MSPAPIFQVWPDDDFAEGATAYGTIISRYLRIRPWTPTTSVQTYKGAIGEPYRLRTPGAPYAAQGEPLYGAATHVDTVPSGTTHDELVGSWVERSTYIADGEVRASFNIDAAVGQVDLGSKHFFGVCGRVQGGQQSLFGTLDEAYLQPQAYYFVQVKRLGVLPELRLYRASGIPSSLNVTVLASADVSDFEVVDYSTPNAWSGARLRMVISGTTSTRIQCYRTIQGPVAYGEPLTGGEELIFDYTDTTAPLTSSGRWGVISNTPYEYTNTVGDTTIASTFCTDFRIRNAAGSNLYVRELWLRAADTIFAADTQTVSGRYSSDVDYKSLSQAYTGDRRGYHDAVTPTQTHRGHLLADTGFDRLVLGIDPTTAFGGSQQHYGWYFSQCPERSPQQHKQIEATFLNTATSPRETRALGLHLRGSVASPVTYYGQTNESLLEHNYKAGYRAYVEYVHSGGVSDVFTLKVYHHNGSIAANYTSQLIATCDLSALLTLGSSFTFSVEARNFDVDPVGEGGNVALRFYINGSPVTPVAELITGLSVEDDWLFDSRSGAIYSGDLVGMYAMIETFNSSGLILVDGFTSQALSDAPIDSTGSDQATIPLASETANKSGTLTLPISWPVTENHVLPLNDIEFDTGHRQTLPIYIKKRRTWEVQALGATAQQRKDLAQFFEDHLGTEIPFDWTYVPTGESVTVRFGTPDIASRMLTTVGDGGEDYRFSLIEVFDASTFNP